MVRKPQLVWRRMRRKAVRNLRDAVDRITAMDEREAIAAADAGVEGVYFSPGSTTNVGKGLTNLRNRCEEALAERA